jgi:hypothetical protein
VRQVQRLQLISQPVTLDGRLAVSIAESVIASGVGRSSTYEAIARGDLRARKIGGRTLILIEDLVAWLQGTPIPPKKAKVDGTEAGEPAADGAGAAHVQQGAEAGAGVRDGNAK